MLKSNKINWVKFVDEIEEIKRKMKLKRNLTMYRDDSKKKSSTNKYINGLITRSLIAIIVFFSTIILMNFNKNARELIDSEVYTKNISFAKISNLYNKYFGNVIPLKNISGEDSTVFNEKFTYESIENYQNGFLLNVKENYLIPVIESGIVVFMGDKDGYGNTIIVQGIDGIDYWYGNVQNANIKIYDYVSASTLLGTALGSKMYIVFQKDGEYLDYDEVMG